ncbi:c6 zinc finger domain containing [Pyrenophora seminiperda CCB06]|uniref:C6 zinc finger domain containing n=1 Tax=Pyrenophora seminiperda CCB06 TaxID=1302712 RepID=A0A3M7LXG2_9PLEO|nr:c6 zinc finger domain containing [Pyrenophora seminiperda CCB06]
MDDNNAPKGQRPRLTCTECYRRKIKCDKNVPCSTCIKRLAPPSTGSLFAFTDACCSANARGYASFCTREDAAATPSAPPAYQARSDSTTSSDLVRALLDRVSQLEAKLQEQHDSSSSDTPRSCPAVDNSPTTLNQHETSTLSLPPDNTAAPPPTETGDVATVLEFLAWGRKKDADYGTSPEHHSGPRRLSARRHDEAITSNILSESSRDVQLDVLEALLPNKTHIVQLVEFHNTSILWYHSSYSSTIFNNDLQVFLAEYEGNVRNDYLNLQWLGLLFAVITGSITCAPPSVCESWGFSLAERIVLSQKWYEATVTCLNIAQYIEIHTIYSVQAIATLTIAAHSLGKSSSQSILLAAAGRIAQSLGLHRLGPEDAVATTPKEQLREREAGRRVFNQLCTQDWFQIPFSESYALNPRFCQTAKLMNCNDDDMVLRPLSTPTQASYCNYRYDIAALMPQLLDAMAGCNTLFTKYEQVLQYDEKMRQLATACMPTFLSTNAPVATDWPIYVGWARRSLTICASHKIIMIHRNFLGLSFTNSAFSFTRRTCLAASKTILKEALSEQDGQGPILWIEQAFAVAAGIILSLDTFHRSTGEKEFEEHTRLVADTISYLKQFDNSKIASRGVELLSALQEELREGGNVEVRKRPRAAEHSDATSSPKRTRLFNVDKFITNVSQNLQVTTPATTPTSEVPESVADLSWNSFANFLPPQTGFGGQNVFDELLSFQF